MEIGLTLMVIAVLIVAIWIIIEIKRMKHKIFAILLIVLILFAYFSFGAVFKDKGINWKSSSGAVEGFKIYFSWLGSVFSNTKSITSYATKIDWVDNESIQEKQDEGSFRFSGDE